MQDYTHLIKNIYIYEQNLGKRYLERTTGEVVSYNGNEIPTLFKTPLKKSDLDSIVAVPSGQRSAIIETEGEVYKLKGIIPSNRKYEEEGVPFGCLKESSCLAELNASWVMTDFGNKKGVKPPLEPALYFRYGISFEGEPVCCSVQKVGGEDRLVVVGHNLMNTAEAAFKNNLRDGEKISEIRQRFTNRIGEWLGFWYGSLERANLCWGTIYFGSKAPQTNLGIHNIVLYPVDGGIGLSMVDLDKSYMHPSDRVKEYEINHIRKDLASFDSALYFLENGKHSSSIAAAYLQKMTSPHYPSGLFKKGSDPFHGVLLPKDDDLEIIKHFEQGRKGKIPEPIEKEFFTETKEKILGILK
jgi:hypothetical protein